MADKTAEETQGARRERRRDFRDPKKHFVRLNGWLPVFQEYSAVRQRRVRYLTLCSKEALDVRYFAHKGCLYRNRDGNLYPSLTWIEADREDYAVIAESLGRTRLAVLGSLEDVVLDVDHESHNDLIGTFPHDIINLDFCGDILPNGDHPRSRTLLCVEQIIRQQAAAVGLEEWHLFLTFRAQPITGSAEANAQVAQQLQSNIDARDDVREAYGNRPSPNNLQQNNYAEFLRIGVPKLLANCAIQNGFELSAESSFVYGRHENQYQMVKIVARFSRFRGPNELADGAADNIRYIGIVRGIFESEAVDVDNAIIAAEQATADDLQPVLDELTRLRTVTS